jgi:solute carrier family 25 S-adenosylmethionine transporter 26
MMKNYLHVVFALAILLSNANTICAKKSVEVAAPTTRTLSNGEMAAAGAAATVFGVTIMHPVDTIKTLQQSTEGAGLNMIQASQKILKDGGIPAMYSGLGPYVTSDGMAGAFKFATYEVLKKLIKEKVPEEHQGKAIFVAAAAAFLASSVVLVPGELLKQRLQMGQIASVRSGIPQIFKNEGILGFYAGYSGVCLRDVPYTMLELGIYDNFKSMYLKLKNRTESNQWDELLAAAISGGITGLMTAPLDNIKTKLMVDTGYNGFFDCLSKTVKNGGMPALFAGSAARVAWLMPFTAIYLPVYEIIKRRMEIMPAKDVSSKALMMKGGFISEAKKDVISQLNIFARGGATRDVSPIKSFQMDSQRFAGSSCF